MEQNLHFFQLQKILYLVWASSLCVCLIVSDGRYIHHAVHGERECR